MADKDGVNLDHGKCSAKWSVIDHTHQSKHGFTVEQRSQPHHGAAEPTLELDAAATYHYINKHGTCYHLEGMTKPSLIESYSKMQVDAGNRWGHGACPAAQYDGCNSLGEYTLSGDTFTSSWCDYRHGLYHYFKDGTCYQLHNFTNKSLQESYHVSAPAALLCPSRMARYPHL